MVFVPKSLMQRVFDDRNIWTCHSLVCRKKRFRLIENSLHKGLWHKYHYGKSFSFAIIVHN